MSLSKDISLWLEQGVNKIKDDPKVVTNFPFILPDFMSRHVYTYLDIHNAEQFPKAYALHGWLLNHVSNILLTRSLNEEERVNALKSFALLDYLHLSSAGNAFAELEEGVRLLYHPNMPPEAFEEMYFGAMRFTNTMVLLNLVRQFVELLNPYFCETNIPNYIETSGCMDYVSVGAAVIADYIAWLQTHISEATDVINDNPSTEVSATLAREMLLAFANRFKLFVIQDSLFFS